MSQARAAYPRRDEDGRVTRLPDLLGVTLAGLVIGLLALVLLDGVFTLVGLGRFGRTSGWLVVILPAWLFVEEFRAWGGRPPQRAGAVRGQPAEPDLPPAPGPARVAAALVAAAVGVAAGLLVAGTVATLAPLWTGAIAGAVFAWSYALIWFLGIRWLTRRMG